MKGLRPLLVQLIQEQIKPNLIIGEVVKVEGASCDIKPFDSDLEYSEILLNCDDSEEFVIIPELKSVVVALLFEDGVSGVVVACSEVSEIKVNADIKINGGIYSTLKGSETIEQLGKMSKRIDCIIDAIKQGAVTPSDGGAGFKASMVAMLSKLESEELEDLENERVKHG